MSTTKRRSRLVAVLALLVGLGAAMWALLGHFERSGRAFFGAGQGAVLRLKELSQALAAGDRAAIEAAYAPDFSGSSLGLADLQPAGEKDGISELAFTAAPGTQDRAAAVGEWRRYLAGFAKLDELGLHVHRVERWSADGEVTVVARFEAIGTPQGRREPGIDRGLFRLHLLPRGGQLVIQGAALVAGARLAADVPQFTNVGAQAGIDFENRFYPPFLAEDLRFGMIRYGPAGISAVDFDNDGWEDLFIPDGVESRLFRNRRDGTFEDVTVAAGLGGLDGVSTAVFADFDNDGWKDVFVSRTFQPNQIFHNDGPDVAGTVRFRDVTAASGIGADCCTTVASVADYDNDGLLDLYVGRYLDPRQDIPTTFYARNGEPNQLYRNRGDGSFENVTVKAGVGELGLCLGSVFGDYDDDGDADLYVVNDFGRNTLYRNEGDGTFTDVTVASGTLAYGAGMSASFGDADNDGRLDLYVANIRSEHGWFAERPTVLRYMANSWRQGVWRSDMPLYLEIFRQSGTRFVEVFQQMASGNNLLLNRGGGRFEDVTWESGANPIGWFWGSGFADFDNDGWQDVYSANGWVYNQPDSEIELEFLNNVVGSQKQYKSGIFFDPQHFGTRSWHGWERNRHLRSNGLDAQGKLTFTEIGRPAGTDLLTNSRGIAVADFWNRGVLDIAVAASTDRHALLRNEVGRHRHWLELQLRGVRSNRDAVGARVSVRTTGGQALREVVAGDGYASENSLRLHFGLGTATRVESLHVRWPSGSVQELGPVAADQVYELVEGEGLRPLAIASPAGETP